MVLRVTKKRAVTRQASSLYCLKNNRMLRDEEKKKKRKEGRKKRV